MKNKKTIYILIPIVLLIWGSVIYQFFTFSNDVQAIEQVKEFELKPLEIERKDTFAINVNYRDPFLGKIYSSIPVPTKAKASKNIKDEAIVFPSIQYKGIVSDNNEKSKVFMLVVDGQTFLMKKGNVENDVVLKDGNRKAVTIIYRGKPSTIPIQE